MDVQVMPSKVLHKRHEKTKAKRAAALSNNPAAKKLALQVIANITELAEEVSEETQDYDANWAPDQLMERVLGVGTNELASAMRLLEAEVAWLLNEQEPLSEVKDVPCKVY